MTEPYKPLTKADVAVLMSVSKRTIDNWVSDHTLPMPTQIGRRVYWHPAVIANWLEEKLGDSSAPSSYSTSESPRFRGRPRNQLAIK